MRHGRSKSVTNSETYNVEQGSTRLPEIESVPYVDVVGALNDAGDHLTLFCVNRDLTRNVQVHVHIDGFVPHSAVAHSIHSESLYDKNDETAPERIRPRDSTVDLSTSDFKTDLSRASVTVIELSRN